MVFKRLSKDKIKILLSKEDMLDFALEYEQIDYQDKHTRDAILSLLELAEEKTGFYPAEGHLFVEAYPQKGNGCILYFTAVADGETESNEGVCVPVVFQFDDIDIVISGARALFKTYGHRIFKSSLYYLNNLYYLVIYPLDQSQLQSVMLLGEYGSLYSKGNLAVAYIHEHCKEIISDSAIENITYYLSAHKSN